LSLPKKGYNQQDRAKQNAIVKTQLNSLKSFLNDSRSHIRKNILHIDPEDMNIIIGDIASYQDTLEEFKDQGMALGLIDSGLISTIDGLLSDLDDASDDLALAAFWHPAKEKAINQLENKPVEDYVQYLKRCIKKLGSASRRI
jgi:hypothetical protein